MVRKKKNRSTRMSDGIRFVKAPRHYTQFNQLERKSRPPEQFDLFSKPPELFVYSRTMPIKTVTEGKQEAHWSIPSKRHKNQKDIIHCFLKLDKPKITTPCTVKLIRIAPRSMDDHDNLKMSFKWIVDAIAEYIHPNKAIGRADDDKKIKWEYAQEKGAPKEYAIRIEITKNPNC